MNNENLWKRYTSLLFNSNELGLSLDISRMRFDDQYLKRMEPAMSKALQEMKALEGGAIANRDEGRMVGHYWLRNPQMSPSSDIRSEIEETLKQILDFCRKIHGGEILAPDGNCFRNVLIIGIGGSALGPQFIADSLSTADDRMKPYFLDNTDPDGFDRVFSTLGDQLGQTLTIVISKSGSTKETRNGMLETKGAYARLGLEFNQHAVAITGNGSELDKLAEQEKWIARFPMWDWVGGRTSVCSAVGLLPAALQGIDIQALLAGAASCDEVTRSTEISSNPAALMALMWYYATEGSGKKDLVMLPYKDRLLLFSRYLQQLIMESLGKGMDLNGNPVCQGMAVYGNKGSTDQHAYVQQLREGVANFFVTFIEVLKDRQGEQMQVEPNVTSGDFLFGFLQGTRQALYENGRDSMTITIDTVNAKSIGILIALLERSVGLYASLININAYHQPGVEAGKKAAEKVITLQREITALIEGCSIKMSVEQIAEKLNRRDEAEMIFCILRHLAANSSNCICKMEGKRPEEWLFSKTP